MVGILEAVAFNKTVNRTPKAYRFWFPPLALRRRLPQRYVTTRKNHSEE
jgi:hypothetical protein